MSQWNARFRHSDKLHRLLRGDCERQRLRISQPDIFACKNYDTARDEAKIFAGVQHLRASPSLSLARCRRASPFILTVYLPRPRSESASARSIKISSCSTVSGSSRKTSERETSALLT